MFLAPHSIWQPEDLAPGIIRVENLALLNSCRVILAPHLSSTVSWSLGHKRGELVSHLACGGMGEGNMPSLPSPLDTHIRKNYWPCVHEIDRPGPATHQLQHMEEYAWHLAWTAQ